MENTRKEYSENDSQDPQKMAAEYGNSPAAASNESRKTPGNESFEHADNDPNAHKGSEALAEKYNINDKAHTDSSKKDFVKTTSNFHHAGQSGSTEKNNPFEDSRNHS